MNLSSTELVERALAGAEFLVSTGVGPGDRVGLIGPNAPEWPVWAFAVWFAGGVLVPLPFPLRVRDPEAFRTQLGILAGTADAQRVVSHPRFRSAVSDELHIPWDMPLAVRGAGVIPDLGAEDDVDQPAMIQFTSGTSASPKGALLTHGAILAALRNMAISLDWTDEDRPVSWLPFFHDLGLMFYLLGVYLMGCSGHVLPTERFAEDPAAWFRVATRAEATITGGPSSAWGVALRSTLRSPSGTDLSSLRIGTQAAETIDPDVVDGLVQGSDALHLDPSAIASGYGMAEVTLGLTVSTPGNRLRIDQVDLEELSGSRRAVPATGARSKRIVSCGRPIAGVRLRIVGGHGEAREREVGEIRAQADSMMRGYVGDPSDPFVEGWFPTGDLGYFADGELFVTGRSKDIVIVMGRNYSPEDIEWAAGRVEGVRTGRCVAFAAPDAPDGVVVVAVEPREGADPADLPARVRQQVLNTVGITVRSVLVVPPGTIPKTTSGKLQRGLVREGYVSGQLQSVALSASTA